MTSLEFLNVAKPDETSSSLELFNVEIRMKHRLV
jgi:hypothetical protein